MAMMDIGRYHAFPKEWGVSRADTGTPYLFIICNVVYAARDGQWVELPRSAERTLRLFLSDAARQYTDDKLTRLGFNGEDFPEEFYQSGIQLDCHHEEYKGKPRERWDIAYDGGANEQNDDSLLLEFKARWKSEHGSRPSGRPSPPPAGASSPAPQSAGAPAGGDSGDDIPF